MVIILIDVLIKYQVIDLNKLLLKIYPKLGLQPQEGVMLLHFLSFYQPNNQQKSFKISLLTLKNKTGLNEKEIKNLISSLENKDFISVSMNTGTSGKKEEYYDISNTLIKIEEFLQNEKKALIEAQTQQELKEVIALFEKELQRTLSPVEQSLLDQNKHNFTKSDYINAIAEISRNDFINVRKCIDYLETKKIMKEEIDIKDVESIKDFLSKLNR